VCHSVSSVVRTYISNACTFRMRYKRHVIDNAQVVVLPKAVAVVTESHTSSGGVATHTSLALAAVDFELYAPKKITQMISIPI